MHHCAPQYNALRGGFHVRDDVCEETCVSGRYYPFVTVTMQVSNNVSNLNLRARIKRGGGVGTLT